MKLNGRGEGGFMESMLAAMVVVISLTAFLSSLSFFASQNYEKEMEVPLDVLGGVRIVDGKIEADIGGKMYDAMERYGYAGMRVSLSIAGAGRDSEFGLDAGSKDSDIVSSRGGTIIVKTDDGRSVPVNYIVAVWL
jgi:hypothetical protein